MTSGTCGEKFFTARTGPRRCLRGPRSRLGTKLVGRETRALRNRPFEVGTLMQAWRKKLIAGETPTNQNPRRDERDPIQAWRQPGWWGDMNSTSALVVAYSRQSDPTFSRWSRCLVVQSLAQERGRMVHGNCDAVWPARASVMLQTGTNLFVETL